MAAVRLHAGRDSGRAALLQEDARLTPVIAIHGGAGRIRGAGTKAALAALARALDAGYAVLRAGESSLDAVTASVAALEDSGLFNAGRGSVRTSDGRRELDASIMDGATLRAGGVAAVTRLRNPVLAARAVMERSRHVLLAGTGAERFAVRHGIERVTGRYFKSRRSSHGTVGAVALDCEGNLAAATSTGGYTGKAPGRVGDSPLVGAGTYADNRTCAVSCTGLGEAFIRAVAAHDVAARILYVRQNLARAAAAAIAKVESLGAQGGLVALDRRGNVAMPYNSAEMYRACVDRRGRRTIRL